MRSTSLTARKARCARSTVSGSGPWGLSARAMSDIPKRKSELNTADGLRGFYRLALPGPRVLRVNEDAGREPGAADLGCARPALFAHLAESNWPKCVPA